jgi:cardiolipin synthase (CMP-forming)
VSGINDDGSAGLAPGAVAASPVAAPGQVVDLAADPPNLIWTIPNAISAVRLLMVPVFAALIVHGYDIWALAVLAFAGFSDWLDGMLARRLNQISRIGQMLDPAADRLFILVTLVGLVWRGVLPLWLAIALLARDALMVLVFAILARFGYAPPPVNFVGKSATFALLYAFPLLLFSAIEGAAGTIAFVLGWAFALWGVGLYWAAGLTYLCQAIGLIRGARAGAMR